MMVLLMTIVNTYRQVEIRPKYGDISLWKRCETDQNCVQDHVCVDMMWQTQNWKAFDSGRGCFHASVCQGSGAWNHSRDIYQSNEADVDQWQFFCNESQKNLS